MKKNLEMILFLSFIGAGGCGLAYAAYKAGGLKPSHLNCQMAEVVSTETCNENDHECWIRADVDRSNLPPKHLTAIASNTIKVGNRSCFCQSTRDEDDPWYGSPETLCE